MSDIDLYTNISAVSCASSTQPNHPSPAAEMSESTSMSTTMNLSGGIDLAKLEDMLEPETIGGVAAVGLDLTEADDDQVQDLVNVPAPELPTSSQTQAIDAVSSPPMMTLPTELLVTILEYVDWYSPTDSVSFGLINRQMYQILKRIYPKPIFDRCGPSFSQILADGKIKTWRWKMQYIIGSFLGPDYRLRFYYPGWYQSEGSDIPFLKRSIYGDSWTQKEKEYNHRWNDWKQNRCVLPHPYLAGEDWYAQAIYFFRGERFCRHQCMRSCFFSYGKTVELHGTTWDAFSEWKDLVRFDGDTPGYRFSHQSDDDYGGRCRACDGGIEDYQDVGHDSYEDYDGESENESDGNDQEEARELESQGDEVEDEVEDEDRAEESDDGGEDSAHRGLESMD